MIYLDEVTVLVRNLNTFNAIMETWEDAKELSQSTFEDPDFALENQEKYMDRMSAKMAQTGAIMSELWYTIFNSDVVNTAVGAFNFLADGMTKVVSLIGQIGTGFGTLDGIFGSITQLATFGATGMAVYGGIKGLKNGTGTILERILTGVKDVFVTSGQTVNNRFKGGLSLFRKPQSPEAAAVTENAVAADADSAALNGVVSAANAVAAAQTNMASAVASGTSALTGQASAVSGVNFLTNNELTNKVTSSGKKYRITGQIQNLENKNLKGMTLNRGTQTGSIRNITPGIVRLKRENPTVQSAQAVEQASNDTTQTVTENNKKLSRVQRNAERAIVTSNRNIADSTAAVADASTEATAVTAQAVQATEETARSGNILTRMGGKISGFWNSLTGFGKFTVSALAAKVAWTGLDYAIMHFIEGTADVEKKNQELNAALKDQRKLSSQNRESIKDMTGEFARLSQGVSRSGKNITLTNGQFERYQEIANKIGDYLPNTIQGYDESGNVILNLRGNVERLHKELKKVQLEELDQRISDASSESVNEQLDRLEGERDFWTKIRDGWGETFKGETPVYELDNVGKSLQKIYDSNKGDQNALYGKWAALLNNQIMRLVDGTNVSITKGQSKALTEALGLAEGTEWTAELVKQKLGGMSPSQIQQLVNQEMFDPVLDIVRGQMNDRFMKEVVQGNLKGLDDDTLDLVQMMLANASNDFLHKNREIEGDAEQVGKVYTDAVVETFKKDRSVSDSINELFKYSEMDNLPKMLEAMYGQDGLMGKLKKGLKGTGITEEEILGQLDLGDLDASMNSYNRMLERLAYRSARVRNEEARKRKLTGRQQQAEYRNNKKINKALEQQGLSLDAINDYLANNNIYLQDELDKLYEFIAAAQAAGDIDPWRSARNKFDGIYDADLAASRASDLKANVEAVKETRKAVNEAWKNSYSVTGMETDDIDAMTNYYKRVMGANYDEDRLFEKTAAGVRLNTQELRNLNSEYKKQELAKYNHEMERLHKNLSNNRKEMNAMDRGDPQYKILEADRDSILKNMQNIETYRSQIEGMFSKANLYFEAENNGEAGDVYDEIQGKIKGVEELWDKGLVGTNKFRTFVDLFTNEDLETANPEQIVKAYSGAMTKAKRYFTEGGEGAENFLKDVEALNKGWAEFDEATQTWHLDFPDEGILAEKLGIDESLIPLIEGKLRDYGAVIEHVNETALEKNLRLKARKTSEAVNDDDKKKYHLGSEATEEYTGIKDDGSGGNLERITAAANEYEKAIGDVTDQIEELEQAKAKGKPIDEAELERLKNLNAALVAQKEYQDQVAESIKNRQKSYQTSEGQENLNNDLQTLKDGGIVEDGFKIQWDRNNADYLKGKKKELLQSLANEGLYVNGQLQIDNLPEEQKQAILHTISELNQAIAQTTLDKEFNLTVSDDTNIQAAHVRDSLENIKAQCAELNGLVMTPGVDPSEIEGAKQKLSGLIESFCEEYDVEITPEIQTAIAEGDFGAFIRALQEDNNVDILADVEINGESLDKADVKSVKVTGEIEDIVYPKDNRTPVVKGGKVEVENIEVPKEPVTLSSKIAKVDVTADTPPASMTATIDEIVNPNPPVDVEVNMQVDDSNYVNYTPMEKHSGVILLPDGTEVDGYVVKDHDGVVRFYTEDGQVVAYQAPGKEGEVKFNVNQTLVSQFMGKNLDRGATVTFRRNSSAVDNWQPADKYATVHYRSVGAPTNKMSMLNGSAHAGGTAKAHGDWGVSKKESGTSLVGELGREIIVRGSKWFSVGDRGAEFFALKPGDIVFNSRQSSDLLKHGYINSRARVIGNGGAKANGSAYVHGTAMVNGGSFGTLKFTKNKNFYSTGAGTTPKAASTPKTQNIKNPVAPKAQKETKEFKEKLDWIAILIDRIEQEITKLDKVAGSAFTKLATRTAAAEDQLSKLREEQDDLVKGAERYLQEANSVQLSEDWAKKVRNGAIDISTITDETLKKNIDEYQQWYEKYLELTYKVVDITEEMGTTIEERFNMIAEDMQNQIDRVVHIQSMLDKQLDEIAAQGRFAGKQIFDTLLKNQQTEVDKLKQKYELLQDERRKALDTGIIEEESEADYNMVAAIEEVKEAWKDAEIQLLEYKNSAMEMRNDIFNYGMKLVDDLRDESTFIQGLISLNESDLFDKDTGRLTNSGHTVNSLHALNYNVAMNQADQYGKYIEKINAELANDPNNTKLIDAKMEYVQAQREAIEAANDEKIAVRELVSQSYSKMIEAMQKLVTKRKDYLQSQKDELDYQKDIEEQSKKVSKLRKQLLAYQGDDSEEAKATKQKISVDLVEAEKRLQESEYSRWLSDQTQLMDDQVTAFEEFLNERLDHLDEFMLQYIDYSNQNADMLSSSIYDATQKVGYQMSDSMYQIWNAPDGIVSNLTNYNDKFLTELTSVNYAITNIWKVIEGQITKKAAEEAARKAAEEAEKKRKEEEAAEKKRKEEEKKKQQQQAAASKPATNTKKNLGIGSHVRVNGNEPIYWDSNGTVGPYGSHQYFANDPNYYIVGERNGYYLLRHHSESTAAGWFKKSAVRAFDTGGYTGNSEGIALLHKKERVLNAQQTEAFDSFVYAIMPKFAELAKQMNVASGSMQSGNIGQMNVSFNLPNVTDWKSFIREAQNSKQFESWLQSVTVDALAGKNSLAKHNKKF